MQPIDTPPPSEDFIDAWMAAGRHLQRLGGDSLLWMREDLDTPFIEHLSFRLGNQLIFVYVLTESSVSAHILEQFHKAADVAHATPCLMPMIKSARGYETALPGWGLRHSRTGDLVDVAARATDELIPLSDWEVHHFGLRIAAASLRKQGAYVQTPQSNPGVSPQIWFRYGGETAWVLVRTARYPDPPPSVDEEILRLAQGLQSQGDKGIFMGIAIGNPSDPSDPESPPSETLYRGRPLLRTVARPVELMAYGEPSREIEALHHDNWRFH